MVTDIPLSVHLYSRATFLTAAALASLTVCHPEILSKEHILLTVCRVESKLLNAAFYETCRARVRINGEESDSVLKEEEVKLGCIMLL